MEPILLLATMAEVPAIEQIVEAAYSPYIARIGRKPGPMLDDYAALTRQGHVRVLAVDGEVRGLLVLVPEDDVMLVDNIAIAPAAQGQGLGRRLLQAAEAIARGMGYRRIRLYTHEMMTENIALYTRWGYAETHRAEEKGLRRVFMTKSLA